MDIGQQQRVIIVEPIDVDEVLAPGEDPDSGRQTEPIVRSAGDGPIDIDNNPRSEL